MLGLFDVSARPHVLEDMLTFAAPMNKYVRMVEDMDESLIITHSGEKTKKENLFQKRLAIVP